MKGIILAGGTGSRLFPITKGVSKQLLHVYNKPMIYYPLSVLMLANIRDILLITTPEHQASFIKLLGNGADFGVNISYAVQEYPDGLAKAFTIGKNFIGRDPVCLVLGDNIFWGQGLTDKLKKAANNVNGATIFGYQVENPKQFGVVEFDASHRVISVEEKPEFPRSNYAITGLYFYDNDVVQIAEEIKPSARGEFEITSINEVYLKNQTLKVDLLGRGYTWWDTGTFSALMSASLFVETVERGQGNKIACLEEIAYKNGWIKPHELEEIVQRASENDYYKFLSDLAKT
jgi:glucose-1-phosphate thymidylyltransferase